MPPPTTHPRIDQPGAPREGAQEPSRRLDDSRGAAYNIVDERDLGQASARLAQYVASQAREPKVVPLPVTSEKGTG